VGERKGAIRAIKSGFGRFLVRWSSKFSRKNLYEFLIAEFNSIPAGSKVLNVGSGGEIGKTLDSVAAAKGFAVTSMDIDPDRKPDLVGDLMNTGLQDNSYDALVLSEVLEHIKVPHAAIAEVHRILKPGGRVIITAPLLFTLHDRPADFYRFTKYGLAYLLSDFRDVTIKERDTWAESLLVVPIRLLFEKGTMCKITGGAFLVMSLVLHPIAIVLGRLCRTDFLTTGYNVTAVKQRTAS
jgi:SAM-dependent methyltransferase